jgi:hypothetical protein
MHFERLVFHRCKDAPSTSELANKKIASSNLDPSESLVLYTKMNW